MRLASFCKTLDPKIAGTDLERAKVLLDCMRFWIKLENVTWLTRTAALRA
jgi:hypothetical protein